MENLACLGDLKMVVVDVPNEHVHGVNRRGTRVPISLSTCALLVALARAGEAIAPLLGHWGHGSPIVKILSSPSLGG